MNLLADEGDRHIVDRLSCLAEWPVSITSGTVNPLSLKAMLL